MAPSRVNHLFSDEIIEKSFGITQQPMLLVLGRALIASIFLVMSVLHIMEPVEQAGQEDRPAIHLTASAYALNAFELGSGTAISTGVAIS